MDDDGFFMGELNGRRGLVPSNFLTDVPPGYIFVDQSPHVIRSSTSNQPRILGTQRRWWSCVPFLYVFYILVFLNTYICKELRNTYRDILFYGDQNCKTVG